MDSLDHLQRCIINYIGRSTSSMMVGRIVVYFSSFFEGVYYFYSIFIGGINGRPRHTPAIQIFWIDDQHTVLSYKKIDFRLGHTPAQK